MPVEKVFGCARLVMEMCMTGQYQSRVARSWRAMKGQRAGADHRASTGAGTDRYTSRIECERAQSLSERANEADDFRIILDER